MFFGEQMSLGDDLQKERRVIPNSMVGVDPGYKYMEKLRGYFQRFTMESRDFISSKHFKLKIENGNLVSFNGGKVTFLLPMKQI